MILSRLVAQPISLLSCNRQAVLGEQAQFLRHDERMPLDQAGSQVEERVRGTGLEVPAPDAVRAGDARRSGSRPRIVALLPRGEAIRNFVYSGALDQVADRADLTVLSVIPSDGIRTLLDSRYPRVIPLNTNIEEHWLVPLECRGDAVVIGSKSAQSCLHTFSPACLGSRSRGLPVR